MTASADDLGLPAAWWGRVGHDLRGPLGPMRMAVQLLRSGRGEESERREALQMMDRQIDRLLAEIEDVAELMRLRNGIFTPRTASTDLNLALDSVGSRVSLLRALADRDQSLEVVPAEGEVNADYDPARLCALLEFLLRKAGATAAQGAALRVAVVHGDDGPVIEVQGQDAAMAADPEIAWVMGATGAAPDEVGARAVLMREFARRGGIGMDSIDAPPALRLRIPRATAIHEA